MKILHTDKGISAEQMVGKTVASVEYGYVDGEYGAEPVIFLIFTDETFHGVLMPPEVCIKETVEVKEP